MGVRVVSVSASSEVRYRGQHRPGNQAIAEGILTLSCPATQGSVTAGIRASTHSMVPCSCPPSAGTSCLIKEFSGP
ncbi:hypothetical protein E2C01_096966 [Portunus trituberculatus]|uniref:Uncharacterized protein n=1 Tax=Portunus trituberculatus TaxID=210409 RepID=A0A5B7K8P9_PORTR|nr:hypothetical protein [Portunus trituberculatus]